MAKIPHENRRNPRVTIGPERGVAPAIVVRTTAETPAPTHYSSQDFEYEQVHGRRCETPNPFATPTARIQRARMAQPTMAKALITAQRRITVAILFMVRRRITGRPLITVRSLGWDLGLTFVAGRGATTGAVAAMEIEGAVAASMAAATVEARNTCRSKPFEVRVAEAVRSCGEASGVP